MTSVVLREEPIINVTMTCADVRETIAICARDWPIKDIYVASENRTAIAASDIRRSSRLGRVLKC